MTRSKGPHISVFTVRKPEADHEFRRTVMSGDEAYILTHLDGIEVTGQQVEITVRKERGVPRLVYIDGGWPLYETWVYDEKSYLIAHFDGHMKEKELDRRRFDD